MMTTVLFDLDGTLLPMDQDEFVNTYFGFLIKKMAPYGYEKDELIATLWKGTAAMVKNDGTCPNEDRFWEVFAGVYGQERVADKPIFDEFYAGEFDNARAVCPANPDAARLVRALKAAGIRVVMATNPFFPLHAQKLRMDWAGLDPEDFAYITSYENSCYCKPNPMYFTELIEKLGLTPGECLMVGNDAGEDTAALAAGIPVFLLTDCLINKTGRDLSDLPQGGFPELFSYLEKACNLPEAGIQ